MTAATEVVHWPGKDTPMCDKHAEHAYRIARAMGFALSSTLLFDDETPCTNCENEAKKKAQAAKQSPELPCCPGFEDGRAHDSWCHKMQ